MCHRYMRVEIDDDTTNSTYTLKMVIVIYGIDDGMARSRALMTVGVFTVMGAYACVVIVPSSIYDGCVGVDLDTLVCMCGRAVVKPLVCVCVVVIVWRSHDKSDHR